MKAKLVTHKDEILRIAESFYKNLFQEADGHDENAVILQILNQGSEDKSNITTSIIISSLAEMKSNKILDKDNIEIKIIN